MECRSGVPTKSAILLVTHESGQKSKETMQLPAVKLGVCDGGCGKENGDMFVLPRPPAAGATLPHHTLVRLSRTVKLTSLGLAEASITVLVSASD